MTTNGYRVSFRSDENVPKLDSGGVCTTLWLPLKLLSCTYKKGESYGV